MTRRAAYGDPHEPLLDRVADRDRDREIGHFLRPPPRAVPILELAVLHERAEDLLKEERIALGALVERLAERRRRRTRQAQGEPG